MHASENKTHKKTYIDLSANDNPFILVNLVTAHDLPGVFQMVLEPTRDREMCWTRESPVSCLVDVIQILWVLVLKAQRECCDLVTLSMYTLNLYERYDGLIWIYTITYVNKVHHLFWWIITWNFKVKYTYFEIVLIWIIHWKVFLGVYKWEQNLQKKFILICGFNSFILVNLISIHKILYLIFYNLIIALILKKITRYAAEMDLQAHLIGQLVMFCFLFIFLAVIFGLLIIYFETIYIEHAFIFCVFECIFTIIFAIKHIFYMLFLWKGLI